MFDLCLACIKDVYEICMHRLRMMAGNSEISQNKRKVKHLILMLILPHAFLVVSTIQVL
jgi:hypothetical protein